MIDPSDVEHRFARYEYAGEKIYLHGRVREECLRLAKELDSLLPDGREKALAITKLEEAMFWAYLAIARDTLD